ncbi:MAG: tetratricopeptide repeat protein [Verrucomicrobiia bacterium]|jgi:tetratricopeptide (TPR) repeat protein
MKNEWKSPAAGATLILLLAFVAYLPALRCGYIWDDDVYVTRNPLLTAPDGLNRIWFTAHPYTAYFPMVNTTLRFEHMLWGLNPAGYHFVNILLHAINALLVWVVLRRLALPGSWLAAAIWAVHPINVESVAWITELKNTQSTLFYLLTLLAWMKFTDKQTTRPWRLYALALLLYGPALFSKTTASTLPAAMLLVLWLRRQPIGWRRFLQIVPFFCYGVGIGLLSMWCEAHSGNYGEALRSSYGTVGRLLIASHALWFYAAKLAWPTQLTFIYPRWEINPHDPRQYIWLIACVAVALLLWWRRQAIGRGPVAAVVFFGATLSPLLGFIPVYTFRYSFVANHYQYVASIGLIALFAGGVSRHADAWQLGHAMRRTLSGALLVVLGALTWQLARIYQDPETLWRDTVAKNPQGWLGHTNLAEELFRQGRVAEATVESSAAFRLKPDIPETNCNLGSALLAAGKVDDAISHFEEAVRLQPGFAPAYINWGVALVKMGKPNDAIRHYETALRINPDDAGAHYNMGVALENVGRAAEAIDHYEKALRTNPDYVEAHVNLGSAFLRTGKVPEAVGEYEQALRINPDYAEAHSNLGAVLQRTGKLPEAIAQYEQALRIKPDYVEAHFNLGLALEKLGRTAEAIEHYQQALKLRPDFAPARNALARLRADQ